MANAYDGKVVLVTGGGGGFGEGIARHLAGLGAQVVVADLREDAARAVADSIGAERALAVAADVADDASVAAMAAAAVARFGRVDVLVNNAGITHRNQPLLDVDEATFDRVYAVNVKSLYLTARHVVPLMRRQRRGVIVNIASTAGPRPRPGLVWYSGTKGAAITITKGMALELAPDGIRVVAVNPVMGETGLIGQFLPGPDTPEVRAKILSTIPLGRFSRPLDVARAVAYLAGDEADFITGVCMEVDGGRCL